MSKESGDQHHLNTLPRRGVVILAKVCPRALTRIFTQQTTVWKSPVHEIMTLKTKMLFVKLIKSPEMDCRYEASQ